MPSIGSQSMEPTSMTENNEVNVIVGRDMINLNDCTAPQIRYDKQKHFLRNQDVNKFNASYSFLTKKNYLSIAVAKG